MSIFFFGFFGFLFFVPPYIWDVGFLFSIGSIVRLFFFLSCFFLTCAIYWLHCPFFPPFLEFFFFYPLSFFGCVGMGGVGAQETYTQVKETYTQVKETYIQVKETHIYV